MEVLTDNEKLNIQTDMKTIIGSFGVNASVYRPVKENINTFYGSKQTGLTKIYDSIKCEIIDLSPDDSRMKGHDLLVNILSDVEIKEDDIFEIKNIKYKVKDIIIHNCFGVITHKEIKLERMRIETN